MPHELLIEGARLTLGETADVSRAGNTPLARLHRLAGGDVVVIAAAAAQRDGVPMLGQLAIVERGAGALLRIAGLRMDIEWRTHAAERAAQASERCRLCFGAFGQSETGVTCACDAVFHRDCHDAYFTCPACGRPPAEDAQ